jgi:hypothetical protein
MRHFHSFKYPKSELGNFHWWQMKEESWELNVDISRLHQVLLGTD